VRAIVLTACLALACSKGSNAGHDGGRASPTLTTSRPDPDPGAKPNPSSTATTTVDVISSASPGGGAYAWKPVVTNGSVDGAGLRTRNRARLAKDKTPVTIVQGGNARSLGERICQAKVPTVPIGTPVLIKPNMGGFDWFKDGKDDNGVRGRITDPEFVRGIIRCLKAKGLTRITVAEGWGATHKDWEKLIDVSGYKAMTENEKVALVAMDDDGVFDLEGTQPGKPLKVLGMQTSNVPTLLMPKILAEHLEKGLFISAPKIKAHRYAAFSMSIKAMQGTVMLSDAAPAYKQKWRMHKELSLKDAKLNTPEARKAYVSSLETFAERIADVLEVEAPHVVLAEGAPAMSGDGFQLLVPSAETFALGGTNPVLVDRVGASLLGLYENAALGKELGGYTTSPLLVIAAKRFGIDLTNPRVDGDGAALFGSARPVHFRGIPGFEIVSSGSADPVRDEGHGGLTPTWNASPELHAAQLVGTIALDGDANEQAWKSATPATFATDYQGRETNTASGPVATSVRALWSADALHMHFLIRNTEFNVDKSRPVNVEREGLYNEDCVEIFVAPDPARRNRYAEIELGPFGHFFDLWVDRDAKTSDTTWTSDLKVATKRGDHQADIEVRIAAPEIVRALKAGARLPLGLYRMEGRNPRRYLAWSPPKTAKPNFHVPSAFGTLVLDTAR
jgi:uncharacterized protein (DUF362 family)